MIATNDSNNDKPESAATIPVTLSVGLLSVHIAPDEGGFTILVTASGEPAASMRFGLNAFPSATLNVADDGRLMLGFDQDGRPVCFAFDSRDEIVGVHPIDRFDPPVSAGESVSE